MHAFEHDQMGTRFRLLLVAGDAARAEAIAERAFARLDALDAVASDWDARSELRRLCAASADELAGPIAVSDDLFRLLSLASELNVATGGAFDVTVGPAVLAWRRARRQRRLPDEDALAALRARIDARAVRLDPKSRTVELGRPNMRLDLGGIAKGDALDQLLAVARDAGLEAALVDGGGDVAAFGAPPGRDGWRVELDPMVPGAERRLARLTDGAIATSGDAYAFVELDGRRYSHVIDPATGLGSTRRLAASVRAPSGALADAWASALCVLGPEGLPRLRAFPALEAIVVELDEAGEARLHAWPPDALPSDRRSLPIEAEDPR